MTDIISIKVAGWIIGTSAVIAGALGFHDGVATIPVETENVGGPSSGTINTLDQWVGSTSPTTAITQRVFGKGIRITGLSDGCLSLSSGLLASSGSACGAGGGASGGTWSTTTSQVSGQLVNYPNNATDIVNIGSNSTTTGEFWLDPNTNTARFTGSATTTLQFVPGGINPAYRLGLSWIESTPSMSFLYDGSGTGDSNKLTIWDDSALIERFTFQRGGNFGIATTSPYAKLSVVGEVVARNFTATSSAATSTFTNLVVTGNASTTNLTVSNLNAASCDVKASTSGVLSCGTDATGAGGSGSVSTSTNEVANQVAVFTSNSATPALIGGDSDFTFLTDRLTVTNASTSRFSALNEAKFGATATTTINSAGNVSLPAAGTLTIPALTSAILQASSGGVFEEYAGTSCTNQFPQVQSALGIWTCDSVVLTTDVSGILPYANGGTGTTTAPVSQLLYGGSTAYQSVATTTLTGTSPLSFSQTVAKVGGSNSVLSWDFSVANIWTGLQSFTNASTTLFSNYGTAYFGTTATTTFSGAGNLTMAAGSTLTAGLLAGTLDAGGATSFEIPNGAPTVDTTGEIGVDTTTGQFKWSYNGSSLGIRLPYEETGFGFASSTQGAATTTLRLGPAPHAITVTSAQCDFSNFMGISLYDGTNRADYFVASSTIGTVTFSTNNTFTAGEAFRVDVGTSTNIAAAVSGGCTFKYTNTAD